jgi:hypothetical protein
MITKPGNPWRVLGTKTMTPAAFEKLPAWPIQRLTENHAKKLLRKLKETADEHGMSVDELTSYHPGFREVATFRLDGTEYKINGHTRSFLIASGAVKGPNTFTVSCYSGSRVAGDLLFRSFDSPVAVDTAQDVFVGLFRDSTGSEPTNFLRAKGSAALKFALTFLPDRVGQPDHNVRMRTFMIGNPTLLKTVNSLSGKPTSGVLAAIFFSLYWAKRLGCTETLPFWENLLKYREGTSANAAWPWFKLRQWMDRNKMHANHGIKVEFGIALIALAMQVHGNSKITLGKGGTSERKAEWFLDKLREFGGDPSKVRMPRNADIVVQRG